MFSTSGVPVTQMITRSERAAKSPRPAASTAPSATNSSSASRRRCATVTRVKPLRSRLRAMPRPIIPSPTKPIRCLPSAIGTPPSRWCTVAKACLASISGLVGIRATSPLANDRTEEASSTWGLTQSRRATRRWCAGAVECQPIVPRPVNRILRLALLAPDIVEAILGGWADQRVMLEKLERPLPVRWDDQCTLVRRPS